MWSTIWNTGILNPMINLLLLLYNFLGNNFFLALIAFTALVRLVMLPINMRQQGAMMKTQELQPQVQAIQKKYKNDPQRMQDEFAKIGYNPAQSLAGCLPLFIQMPIFIGLYRAILYVLASTPQGLFELAQRAYDFVDLTAILPVSNRALWMNLGQPDPAFVLPVLVAGTMFISQKLSMPKKDEKASKKKEEEKENPAAAMQQQMLFMMPLMFGFISLGFPSGLSIYFIVSNLFQILQGYILRRNKAALKAEQAKNGSAKKSTKPVSNKSNKKKEANSSSSKQSANGSSDESVDGLWQSSAGGNKQNRKARSANRQETRDVSKKKASQNGGQRSKKKKKRRASR